MLKKVFILLLLFSLSFGSPIAEDKYNKYAIENRVLTIFRNNQIDIDSKSFKGWIRIFNSRRKLEDYNIYVDEKNRILVLKYFKMKYNHKMNKYERGIE